jgi:hypothetical protein
MHVSPIYSAAFPASNAQHFSSLRARPLPIPSATPAAPLRRPACSNGKVEKRAFSHATSTISHIFAHLSDGGLAKLITPPSLLPLTNSNRQGLAQLYRPRQSKQFRPPKRSFCPSQKSAAVLPQVSLNERYFIHCPKNKARKKDKTCVFIIILTIIDLYSHNGCMNGCLKTQFEC